MNPFLDCRVAFFRLSAASLLVLVALASSPRWADAQESGEESKSGVDSELPFCTKEIRNTHLIPYECLPSELLEAAANRGNNEAQFRIARRYLSHYAMNLDNKSLRNSAEKFALQAANNGHVESMLLLHDIYFGFTSIESNTAEHFSWVLKAASLNNQRAYGIIGRESLHLFIFVPDYSGRREELADLKREKILNWLSEWSRKGNIFASCQLNELIRKSRSVANKTDDSNMVSSRVESVTKELRGMKLVKWIPEIDLIPFCQE